MNNAAFYAIIYNRKDIVATVSANGDNQEAVFAANSTFMMKYMRAKHKKETCRMIYPNDLLVDHERFTITNNLRSVTDMIELVPLPSVYEMNEMVDAVLGE